MVTKRRTRVFVTLCASLLGGSCSEHFEVGRDRPAVSSGASGGSSPAAGAGGVAANSGGGGAGAAAGAAHVCQVASCQGKVYQCGDCVDNDADQRIDSNDPDCTGPCDNTEDSYFGGIPGQNKAPCREDCYFDQDTGSGNDQCFWRQDCDALSIAPDYPPSGEARCAYSSSTAVAGSGSTCAELSASQPAACLDYCLPITPNGCDCFGCCELPADSGKFVWLGSSSANQGTCDAAHVDDPAACHPCTPVKSCLNACDACEVCVGRTAPLSNCANPADNRCPVNEVACGQPGEPDCDVNYYCITGCCVAAPR